MLGLSMSFFAVSAYYTVAVKSKIIKIETISPTLYAIDIFTYKAKAAISDEDERHRIARQLYSNGLYDNLYFYAGFDLMTQLADEGHAPSMLFQANVLLHRPQLDTENKAVAYYMDAAKQGHTAAREGFQKVLKNTQYKLAQH